MSLPDTVLPPKLRKYLAARECVAFVGAGFSMPCGMPNWGLLLDGLLVEAEESVTTGEKRAAVRDGRQALTRFDYTAAAEAVKRLLSKDQLRRHLTSEFDKRKLLQLPAAPQQRMLGR